MFAKFFITRPIFAAVCAAVILLAGAIAIPTLPVAQYPNIAPPQITVGAEYVGANAEAVEQSVTTPLEQAINGVEGLRYISSSSGDDGSSQVVATFNLGRDPDKAAQDVQSRISTVQGILPAAVTQTGVTVSKNSSSFVMAIALTSDNPKYDSLFLSNYADRYITEALKRVRGVGDVIIFGERKYAMRIWLDPSKLQAYRLTADDIDSALREQNVQVAAGQIGAQPEPAGQPYTLNVRAAGRLTSPEAFADVVIKSGAGYLVRIGDVGRVELGAQAYSANLNFNGKTAVGLGVLQLPDANSLNVSRGVNAALQRLMHDFPTGVRYQVAFDTTTFVHESIREVLITLGLAILLVVLVIFLFLQDWRTTLIPAITIPVSLVGTFALLKALGFSINVLTLFGLTLATGLVVDDAIVVIENIARYVQDKKMPAKEAAPLAMVEIASAVIATSLVLLAVFVPVGFFPGTTGELYKQFALTIASSITISAFTALTLTPALAALLEREEQPHGAVLRWVSRAIARVRDAYRKALPAIYRFRVPVIAGFILLLGVTAWMFSAVPTGFIPDEDEGFFVVVVQGPPGSSLGYTDSVMRQAQQIVRSEPDVQNVFSVSGFSFTGVGPNNGIMFASTKPWSQRRGRDHSMAAILGRLGGKLMGITGASAFAFNPPAIQGAGNIGGFDFQIEDQNNLGLQALAQAAGAFEYRGNTDPKLRSVFTSFRTDSPQVLVSIDRNAVKALNIKLDDVYSNLHILLGSDYVNDFNYGSKSYRVYVQGEAASRARIADINGIYVRSASGTMVPLSALVTLSKTLGPPFITHYNLFRSVELNGQPGPGTSTGQAVTEMQTLARTILPSGMGYEWTGTSLEQIEAGRLTLLIFGLAVVFVFLVLAAQYESLVDPFIIITAVPLAILGALTAIWIRGLQNDIFTQVGLVMLVGLASKNSILIVEFGNQLRRRGVPLIQAAFEAAQTRFRPIMMTSLAFIFGITPLVLATGAGQASRHSLGTAVFGGMILSTVLNLFVVPLLYILVAGLEERIAQRRTKRATPAA
ncbi:MAG: multidrug efflux RND transporter permease subunit [Candidatus Eremiobacteraeota bacterium]|nr:multidrug efflux RND transporter permease subunit [Candidatus Eremiobacteraeota bacterium]